MLVLFFHYFFLQKNRFSIFRVGVTGVDLFFIISGFVIYLTLENTKLCIDFAVNRFSRLFPTYWVAVTITTLFLLPSFRQTVYLKNLTMFQHYLDAPNIDDSYWTMLVELLFYFFMALIFATKQLKNIEKVILIVLIICFLYSLDFHDTIFIELKKIISFWFPLINHFPLFFSGILFFYFGKKVQT